MQPRQDPVGPPDDSAYVTWENEQGKALAIYHATQALQKVEPVVRSVGSDLFLNIAPGNVSVRDGFGRGDYEHFRRSEALPVKPKEVIRSAMCAYDDVGIIRNVVDLMGDFAVQGLDIVHPNERIEKFHREWFRKVDGAERSERFLNVLYRCGNVIVKRQTARLSARDEDRLRRATASPDVEVDPSPLLLKREVPWRYTFLNPLSVEVLGGGLATFVGKDAFAYGVKVPDNIARIIKQPRTAIEKAMVERLPASIRKLIASGQKLIPLDSDKVYVAHYKRDDWREWARPMVAPLLKDLLMLEKMKLADLAALDGAISCIRVWKLGNLEARIMPSEAIILRLAQMLANNVGGGVMDLVWGPDIDLLETSTDVHQFLGETKYAPVLNAIFQGLGIPPTLTGNANTGSFTNNLISLKTLTERLEYGRGVLKTFWEHELRLVQKAMGFRFPAQVVFDKLLSDEAAEKQLMLHLWDRNLVSDEAVREAFNLTPEIEEVRVRREQRRRESGMAPPKASPFHDPQQEFGLLKIFAQAGVVTPSEAGVELEERKPGEKSVVERNEKQAKLVRDAQKQNPGPTPEQQPIKKGVPGEGRPMLKKDEGPRKQKTVKPRTSAEFIENLAWSENALACIARQVAPAFLRTVGKKNFRELTDDESRNFESLKFGILCQLPLGQPVDAAAIASALARPLAVPVAVNRLLRAAASRYAESTGREPTLEVTRRFQAAGYALYQGEYDSGEEDGSPAGDGL